MDNNNPSDANQGGTIPTDPSQPVADPSAPVADAPVAEMPTEAPVAETPVEAPVTEAPTETPAEAPVDGGMGGDQNPGGTPGM